MISAVDEVLAGTDWSAFAGPADAVCILQEKLDSESDDAKRLLLSTLIDLLKLHPSMRSGAACPFWPPERADALDLETLRSLAIASVRQHLPDVIAAHMIDAAWYRRACTYDLVCAGADAYLRAAAASLDPHRWTPAFHYTRRAICLSARIRRHSVEHTSLLDGVASLVTGLGEADPSYFCAKVMGLLIDQRYEAGVGLAELAGKLAEAARGQQDFWRAQTHLETKVAWHKLYGEKDAARATAILIAELLEAHAEHASAGGEAIFAARQQAEAVVAWRQIGERSRAEKAHVRLLELQRAAVKTFKRFSTPLDLSDCIAQAKERVSGKSQGAAVLALVSLAHPPAVSRLKEQATKRLLDFVFYALMPRTSVSSTGRVVHISEPADAKAKEEDAALLEEARTDGARTAEVVTVGGIVPAAVQIQLEHGITTRDLFGLVERSSFVPPGRRWSFARGLALGFEGEFALAAHLLMPQFENALREIMEGRGVVVSSLLPTGVQRELDLGALLELSQVKDFLGEDEHFELETLLVSKAGANLRNELAHGLFNDGARHWQLVFFWWKVLRYVVALSAMENVADIPRPEREHAAEDDEEGPAPAVAEPES